MERFDKGKGHQRLDNAFNKELDMRLNSVDKFARSIDKIHHIINVVKKNGLYSQEEMELDMLKCEKRHAPDFERELIQKAWNIRQKANKRLMSDLEGLLIDLEGFLDE